MKNLTVHNRDDFALACRILSQLGFLMNFDAGMQRGYIRDGEQVIVTQK